MYLCTVVLCNNITLVVLCNKKAVALCNNYSSHFVINLKYMVEGQVNPVISVIIDNNNNVTMVFSLLRRALV